MKDKTAAGLFGIFLGGLGIHKFYLGSVGLGIVYILFCWTFVPSLIGFIEGLIYLTMSKDDFDEKYNNIPKNRNTPETPTQAKVKVTAYNTNEDGSYLSFRLAGTNFLERSEINRIFQLNRGEELLLIAEPENQYDPNAISVASKDRVKLGYVPKDMTSLLLNTSGEFKGNKCVFTKKSDHEIPFVYVRVEFI